VANGTVEEPANAAHLRRSNDAIANAVPLEWILDLVVRWRLIRGLRRVASGLGFVVVVIVIRRAVVHVWRVSLGHYRGESLGA